MCRIKGATTLYKPVIADNKHPLAAQAAVEYILYVFVVMIGRPASFKGLFGRKVFA